MERLEQMSVDGYVEAMRGEFERVMREVATVVNAAADGRVIRDSEEQVRDVLGRFRTQAYQKALQMRIDATEASFSPCGPCEEGTAGQGQVGTGPGDGERGGAA